MSQLYIKMYSFKYNLILGPLESKLVLFSMRADLNLIECSFPFIVACVRAYTGSASQWQIFNGEWCQALSCTRFSLTNDCIFLLPRCKFCLEHLG